MRLTSYLIEFMAQKRQENDWSYSEMQRRSGVSYETFRKIEAALVDEISANTVDGICRLTGVTEADLIKIANGTKTHPKAKHDGESRRASALWRWLKHDAKRCDALRLMGFRGSLPDQPD